MIDGTMHAATFQEVESKLLDLIDGRIARAEADRWAATWVAASDAPDVPPHIWRAVTRLYGCDLTHGTAEDYLHSTDQFREWLEELRAGDARE
jgi:hypothetical protein